MPLQDNITQLPKVNKDDFIRSFVREQSSHAKSYVAQGKAVLSTAVSDDSASNISRQRKISVNITHEAPFNTPVLKPRVSKLPSIVRGNRLAPERPKEKPPHLVPKKSIEANKTTKAKRPLPSSSSDEDIENRRAERRNRKRQKRQMVEPETYTEKRIKSKAPAKAKTKAASKTSVPVALALMHGVKPTNIGQARITQPAHLRSGVFGKGMASKQSSKRKGGAKHFNELEFLTQSQKLQKNPSKPRRRSPSLSTSESGTISPTPSAPSSKILPVPKKIKISGTKKKPSVNQEIVSTNKDHVDCAVSEIWDIESRIESKHSNVSAAPSARTFVLANHTWEGLCPEPDSVPSPILADQLPTTSPLKANHSLISLRPSESASQYRASEPVETREKHNPQRSRFFSEPSPVDENAHSVENAKQCPTAENLPSVTAARTHDPIVQLPPSRSPSALSQESAQQSHLSEQALSNCSVQSYDANSQPPPFDTSARPHHRTYLPPSSYACGDSNSVQETSINHERGSSPWCPSSYDMADWDTDIALQDIFPLPQPQEDTESHYYFSEEIFDEATTESVVYDSDEDSISYADNALCWMPEYGHADMLDDPVVFETTPPLTHLYEDGYMAHPSEYSYEHPEIPEMLPLEDTDSFVNITNQFSQGRAILLGIDPDAFHSSRQSTQTRRETPILDAELNVAKNLTGHWYPNLF